MMMTEAGLLCQFAFTVRDLHTQTSVTFLNETTVARKFNYSVIFLHGTQNDQTHLPCTKIELCP